MDALMVFINGLTPLDNFFLVCAAAGGFIFFIRMGLQLLGVDGDADVDGDIGLDLEADSGYHLFTLQGITSFVMMFGLVGLCLHAGYRVNEPVSLLVALIAGSFCLWIVAKMFQTMAGLQSSGTVDIRNAVGQKGKMYLRILPGGTGKVQVAVQGRM
ncbi:hypothetical protein ACFL34_04605, partial [Candidatus Sumerlaeota bacterium]